MRNIKAVAFLALLISFMALPLRADFPVARQIYHNVFPYHDVFPAVAYNSTDDEYLVVWSCLVPAQGIVLPWAGWVFGQRIDASGTLIGDPFPIIMNWCVVNVSVAYNSQDNDYMVAVAYGNPPEIYLQRLSITGTATGSEQVVLSNVQKPRILYNSLANNYLVLGNGSGIFSRVVDDSGVPVGSAVAVTDASGYPDYVVAFAPIVSPETPHGRYLLARSQVWLTMLDSDGKPMVTWFTGDGIPLYEEIPFPTTTSTEHTASLAFGSKGGINAFTVVWSGEGGKFANIAWPGIWTGSVDADKIAYYGMSYSAYDYPVSCIYQDAFYLADLPTWMPVAAYNPATGKFFVAWRQTAVAGPNSQVGVNHIRGEWLGRQPLNPNNPNFVLSRTNGDEDPQYPAVASSTKNGNVLVVWADMRNSASNGTDIYGTLFDISQTVPIQLSSFTALPAAGAGVRLDWTTVSETGNYGFYVQKSKNKTNDYQTIENSFVAGHGTTIEPHSYSFTDVTATQGTWYYRLKQIDLDGTVHFSQSALVQVMVTDVTEATPKVFQLFQNYPNPFNPSTTIRFELPKSSEVTLTVYDVLGREVSVLVNEKIDAGYHEVKFDGSGLSSGIYFYRIEAGSFVQTRKLLMIR